MKTRTSTPRAYVFSLILFVSAISLGIVYADGHMDNAISVLEKKNACAFLCVYPDGFRIFGIGTAVIEDKQNMDVVINAERAATMNARTEISQYIKQTVSSKKKTSMAFNSVTHSSDKKGEKGNKTKIYSQAKFASEINTGTDSLMKNVEVIKIIHVKSKTETVAKALVCYTSNSMRSRLSVPFAVDNASLKNVWLNCKGRGKDRSSAVRAAIIEGIQQVYGAYLENNEVFKKRFNAVRTDKNAYFSIDTEQSQTSLVQCKGFVDEYRILSVELQDNKMYEAIICAHFLNPRANGLKAIVINPMSMPIEKETNNYIVAPKLTLSGRELGKICAKQFEKAFTEANKFLVINHDDLRHAIDNQNTMIKLAENGILSPIEMKKVGKLLTADYFVNSTFEDISYKNKVGYNRRTNKFEPNEQISFSFEYTMYEAKTGARVKNNWIMVVLDNANIREIREDTRLTGDDLGKILFRTVLRRAVELLAKDAHL